MKVWLNGHEWAKRQATKAGVGFTELSNGFASCADPRWLQARTHGHDQQALSLPISQPPLGGPRLASLEGCVTNGLEGLSGIENPVRVQRPLNGPVHSECLLTKFMCQV